MPNSFDKAIEDEPSRFIDGAFKVNPNISNLAEFEEALNSYLEKPKGEISKSTIIDLFESKEVKEGIKENVSSEDYEKLYGDGIKVTHEVVGKRIVTISAPRVSVSSHRWRGQQVSGYSKTYTKWQNSETKFLQVRKKRGIAPKEIIKEYNQHFKSAPRTSSSLSTKLYRI